MDENNVVVENAVETDTTQASSPQAENPITEGETMQGENVQTPVVEESNVPVDQAEQRRAFQELRQENKRLKEEREASLPKGESAFNAFRAQTPPVSSSPVQVQNFTDPITGETDWQSFNQAQQAREQQIIQQAKYEAQQTTQELLDENNARSKYKELFADPEIEQDMADKWLAAKLRGQNVSITQIADGFARKLKQSVSKAEKIGAERILTEVSEKEKAGLTASSQSSQGAVRASSQEEIESLRAGTRIGNQDSVTARISKIPWANK